MKITLFPTIYFSPFVFSISVSGDKLTVNGEEYDFSAIPDGASLPSTAMGNEVFIGNIERAEGQLSLTLTFPISPDASEASRFPAPIINPPDGPLELPQ